MQWHGRQIQVVSLGVGDTDSLTQAALAALKTADVVIGAQHHLDTVNKLLANNTEKNLFPSPFNKLIALLDQNKNKEIVVLASGDALFYGVGKYLSENLSKESLVFHPNVSAMQVAFHRVGFPWQNAVIHSLHGRPLSTLHSRLQNGLVLGLFTDEVSNPFAIAKCLIEQGFSESEIWLCESLGSDKERTSHFKAADITQKEFSPLTICIVKCVGSNKCLPGVAGIADECFTTGAEPGKGMISKREVRLSILSLMECQPNDVAWDIGAGCGSVSIEWALQSRQGIIYAVENNQQRIKYLEINSLKFGTEQLVKSVFGTAPECCASLEKPSVVFVGGNGGNLSELLEFAWSSLKPAGRLVASAVMPESIAVLQAFADKYKYHQGEWVQLEVSKIKSLSNIHQLNKLKPVSILKVIKN